MKICKYRAIYYSCLIYARNIKLQYWTQQSLFMKSKMHSNYWSQLDDFLIMCCLNKIVISLQLICIRFGIFLLIHDPLSWCSSDNAYLLQLHNEYWEEILDKNINKLCDHKALPNPFSNLCKLISKWAEKSIKITKKVLVW